MKFVNLVLLSIAIPIILTGIYLLSKVKFGKEQKCSGKCGMHEIKS